MSLSRCHINIIFVWAVTKRGTNRRGRLKPQTLRPQTGLELLINGMIIAFLWMRF